MQFHTDSFRFTEFRSLIQIHVVSLKYVQIHSAALKSTHIRSVLLQILSDSHRLIQIRSDSFRFAQTCSDKLQLTNPEGKREMLHARGQREKEGGQTHILSLIRHE